jgi:hypothetical protein
MQHETGQEAHFCRNSVCIFRRNRSGREHCGEWEADRIGFVLQNPVAAREWIGFVLNFRSAGRQGSS